MHSHPVTLLGYIEIDELMLAEKTGISKTFNAGTIVDGGAPPPF